MKFKTVYICCGVIPAFAFLSRLPGKIGEQIFDEFLAHAIGQDRSGTGETREFCEDAILMRTLEVLGLEYGCYDPYARRLAEHGIVRFLQDEEPLDDFLRSRLAHLLVRARTYHGTDIARLLHTVSSGLRDDIERRMKGVHLQDNPGFLWSMKTEYQLAAVLSEPVTTPSPQRTVYQNMLRHYYSEQTMAAAIRGWAQELITRLSA